MACRLLPFLSTVRYSPLSEVGSQLINGNAGLYSHLHVGRGLGADIDDAYVAPAEREKHSNRAELLRAMEL
jgi:hypothetical protein